MTSEEIMMWVYGLSILVGVIILPLAVWGRLSNMEDQIARNCAKKIIKLSARRILEKGEYKPVLAEKRRAQVRAALLFILASGLLYVLAIIASYLSSSDSNDFEKVIPLVGPAVIGIIVAQYTSTKSHSFMETLTQEIKEHGMFDQIDAWLVVLSDIEWNKKDLNQEEWLLAWGSPMAQQQLEKNIGGVRFMQQLGQSQGVKRNWRREVAKLKAAIQRAKGLEHKKLVDLAGRYEFWKRLLLGLEDGRSLEMLTEVDLLDDEFKQGLLKVLRQQVNLLKHYPNLYCPVCRSRGEISRLGDFRFVKCSCADPGAMVTGIERVVGMIGHAQLPGMSRSTYYVSVWDEERQVVNPAQIDQLEVAADFAGNIDWALSATIESHLNRYPAHKIRYSIVLPPNLELKPNTRKLVRESQEDFFSEHPG